jgi:hypothetical protein
MDDHQLKLESTIAQYFGAEDANEKCAVKVNFIKLCKDIEEFKLLFDHHYLQRDKFINNNKNEIIAGICESGKFFILDYLIKLVLYQISDMTEQITFMFENIEWSDDVIKYFFALDFKITINAINMVKDNKLINHIIDNNFIQNEHTAYWLQTNNKIIIKHLLSKDGLTVEQIEQMLLSKSEIFYEEVLQSTYLQIVLKSEKTDVELVITHINNKNVKNIVTDSSENTVCASIYKNFKTLIDTIKLANNIEPLLHILCSNNLKLIKSIDISTQTDCYALLIPHAKDIFSIDHREKACKRLEYFINLTIDSFVYKMPEDIVVETIDNFQLSSASLINAIFSKKILAAKKILSICGKENLQYIANTTGYTVLHNAILYCPAILGDLFAHEDYCDAQINDKLRNHAISNRIDLTNEHIQKYLHRIVPQSVKSNVIKKLSSGCKLLLSPIETHVLHHMDVPKKIHEDCDICISRHKSVVFNPCGHSVCQMCCTKIDKCHLCKKQITSRIVLF